MTATPMQNPHVNYALRVDRKTLDCKIHTSGVPDDRTSLSACSFMLTEAATRSKVGFDKFLQEVIDNVQRLHDARAEPDDPRREAT